MNWNNLPPWVRISRPPIVFMAIFGSFAAYMLSGGDPGDTMSILAMAISAGALAAAMMIDNDVADLPSDRINRPEKPLCTGEITEYDAHNVSLVLYLMAPIPAFHFGEIAVIFVVLSGFNSVIYNWWGKQRGHIVGNIQVATGVAGIVFWGDLASGSLSLWPITVGIFVMEIGRELMVTLGDYEGDKKAGFRTLPVIVGVRNTLTVAMLFIVGGMFIMAKPYGIAYVMGWTVLILILVFGWCFAVSSWDDRRVINTDIYEMWFRKGSRLAIVFFQVMMLAEGLT